MSCDATTVSGQQQCASSPNQPPIEHIIDNVYFAGGKIIPLLQSISINSNSINKSIQMIYKTMDPIDILFLVVAAFVSIPLFNKIYNMTSYLQQTKDIPIIVAANTTTTTATKDNKSNDVSTTKNDSKKDKAAVTTTIKTETIIIPYEASYLYIIAKLVSEGARIAIVLFVLDCCVLIGIGIGLHNIYNNVEKVSHVFGKIVYILWFVYRLSQLKRYILSTVFVRSPEKLGRISIIDRLIDGALLVSTFIVLLELLDMEMNSGIKSMFAFGSASTLIIGLASKDLATMFVNGLALSTSNRVNEGDDIKFGDGTTGIIVKIGWIHTIIRNHDNLLEVVPNSQLGMQRVKNLSRVDKCRIQQNIRLSYNDINKLPKVCIDIVNEIKNNSSPNVIIDGSRPVRACFVGYYEDHVRIQITAHYYSPPMGQQFYNCQESCLYAIHRAVVIQNNLQFVTTYYPQSTPLNG